MLSTIIHFLAQKSPQPKLICVIGPTASGKTEVAVAIAKKFAGEIINADSRQMYTLLNIGTAKPTKEEMKDIPHHLFDFLDPKKQCNVTEWRTLAADIILKIKNRKKTPILCGGTGLFVNALTKNFTIPHVAPQRAFREKMEKLSAEQLWHMLEKKDPPAAKKISPQNKRFLIRALEICEFTGKTKSELVGTAKEQYDTLLIGLTLEREKLYDHIHARVETMKEQGFLQEVKGLLQRGYSEQDLALQSLGYPEAIHFLQGRISENEMWEKMKQGTRNYAKRQLTWWRRDERIHWFDSQTLNRIDIHNPQY